MEMNNIINASTYIRPLLSVKEASEHFGIGMNKIRDLTKESNCKFVLYIGKKCMIKVKEFNDFISNSYSI